MKNILIITVLMLLGFGLKAQENEVIAQKSYPKNFGVRIGYVQPLIKSEAITMVNKDYIPVSLQFNETSPRLIVGFWGQKEFGWLYFQGNVSYTSFDQSFLFSTGYADAVKVQSLTNTYDAIELLPLAGLKVNNWRVGVGSNIQLLSKRFSPKEDENFVKEKNKLSNLGFSYNLGYDLSKIRFDLRYDKSFNRVGDNLTVSDRPVKFNGHVNTITLTIGYSVF